MLSRSVQLLHRWRTGRLLGWCLCIGALVSPACADYEAPPQDATGSGSGQGGSTSTSDDSTGTQVTTTSSGSGGVMGSGGTSTLAPMGMVGAPLVFNPTAKGFGINVALWSGDPANLTVRVREQGEASWGEALKPDLPASDVAEWHVDGLSAGTTYEYQVVSTEDGDDEPIMFEGVQVTQREEGEDFRFALLTDTHIGAHLDYPNQGDPAILSAVTREVAAANPDFVMNLGDMLDFHEFGFQLPPPDGDITRLAYLNYRDLLGTTVGNAAHFGVIGNWEGENGNYTEEQIGWSRDARLRYLPGPEPETYPEGGSPAEDYYAFTWGDALFIALNVMSYTPTEHLLSSGGGQADEWTLGQEQLDWLETTLENATSKWRFVLIHHAVGGAAGDVANANYGRGGGQAAHVGEQALVHQLMLDYGVQVFFYGHDHVFTDMVVDDIHYSMPGSAGAIWYFDQYDTGYEESWLVSGWGQVDVTPDSVHVQFIEMGGEVIYEYTLE